MANPAFVDCTENTWTLIATNVVTGNVRKITNGPTYLHTYRETGDPAPTLSTEGVLIFVEEESLYEPISATSGIDVYIYCISDDGRVRVDL